MKTAKLDEMVGGWFVGAFVPVAFSTDSCEVSVKRYEKGAREAKHEHRIATEVTCIVSGRVRMMDQEWATNDILVLEPGDATAFEALEDTVTVVVKVPGVLGDKYLVEED